MQILTAVGTPMAAAVTGVSRPLVELNVAVQLDRSSMAPRHAPVSILANRSQQPWKAVSSGTASELFL